MKFSVIVNKWAVFYFFVQNLAEWHFSNRKDYNVLWRQEVGTFSAEEEVAIHKLKEIHQKYSFGKAYLGLDFFLEKDPWATLKQRMSVEDSEMLQEVFSSLENKFNVFWEKESPLLTEWQKKLNNELNNPSSADRVLEILKVLFNTSPTESGIAILLLPSSPKHTGGGANIGNKNITLEISRYPLEEECHEICLIWNEVIHLSYQKP